MRRLGVLLAVALSLTAISCGGSTNHRVVVAAGTTLVDSGFMAGVFDRYESEAPGVTFSVVGVSSAEAIAYADAGNADMIFTHEPAILGELLDRTPHASVVVPFASRFVVVAPADVPVAIANVGAAFASVAEAGLPFVSRDDASGTNVREREIWASIPVDPTKEDWYTRTGSGMGASLLVADQKRAVTLSELGAFLVASDSLTLTRVGLEDASGLYNPYDLTVIFPAEMPEAAAFQVWIVSEDGRNAIAAVNEELFGSRVYVAP